VEGYGAFCPLTSEGRACVYSNFAIYPRDHIFEVTRPKSTHHIPMVKISIQKSDHEVSERIITSLDTFEWEGISIDIIGKLDDDEEHFGGQHFITDVLTNETWFGPSQAYNSPLFGTVGDIQGNNYDRFTSADVNSFKFQGGIIKPVPRGGSVTYDVPSSGIKNILTYDKLPITYGSTTWNYVNGSIQGSRLSSSALILSMDSRNLRLTVQKNKICPEFEVVSASGCFKCNYGSSVLIKARSTCLDGMVKINATNVLLSRRSVKLSKSSEEFIIDFQTETQSNNFQLCLIGSTALCKIVKFTAFSKDFIDNNTGPGDKNETLTPTDSNFLDRIFSGIGSFLDYVYFILVIIGCVILFVFFGPILITLISRVFHILISFFKMKKSKGE